MTLKLRERISTDTAGIAMCLGLQADTKVELQTMLEQIEAKLPQSTFSRLAVDQFRFRRSPLLRLKES